MVVNVARMPAAVVVYSFQVLLKNIILSKLNIHSIKWLIIISYKIKICKESTHPCPLLGSFLAVSPYLRLRVVDMSDTWIHPRIRHSYPSLSNIAYYKSWILMILGKMCMSSFCNVIKLKMVETPFDKMWVIDKETKTGKSSKKFPQLIWQLGCQYFGLYLDLYSPWLFMLMKGVGFIIQIS